MTSHATSMGIHPSIAAPQVSIWGVVKSIGSTARQRKALGQLDDAALRDVGLTRQQAVAEANRSIWDVPSNWRR